MPHVLKRPRLWYERSGDGPPLLMITGFTISSAVFDPVLHLYEPHFDCIRYDNRGSGRSGSPLRPTSIPELAHDAVRLLDALEIESAHVYGLSMGGMIAQEMAIRFPERVRGLVLGCTTPGGPRAIRPELAELAELGGTMLGALRQDGSPWLGPALFSPEFRREQPQRVRELHEFFTRHRARPQGMAAHWWASVYHDTVARLKHIQAPTLVMHGDRDAMDPLANARLMADRIPDAELALVHGAGHAYALEQPEESFDLFMRWLEPREPIAAGRPHTGMAARAEPLTRAFGLQVGALRTGRSLVGLVTDRIGGGRGEQGNIDRGGRHVAVDRRAA
jgi:pimeloyl-ACP methyl ester carboxylesterase